MAEVVDHPESSRLELVRDGHTAYAQYELGPGTITFTHTLVPTELRGHGLGTSLVEAGLALARARGLKVIPRCPFFRAHFQAHPEDSGLLNDAGRALLGG
ncbi:MAG: N-acetyltransferase [Proteobacteria bacterium]|nr:N-acetyltransferase [Pseudomonadota bacterium]